MARPSPIMALRHLLDPIQVSIFAASGIGADIAHRRGDGAGDYHVARSATNGELS